MADISNSVGSSPQLAALYERMAFRYARAGLDTSLERENAEWKVKLGQLFYLATGQHPSISERFALGKQRAWMVDGRMVVWQADTCMFHFVLPALRGSITADGEGGHTYYMVQPGMRNSADVQPALKALQDAPFDPSYV